ncbi:MAG: ABC transporter ATP-binding protein [Eubacterium sp.]
MNTVLSVKNLTKSYDSFKLDNASFDIEKGEIAGFVGRNGAGKTTAIKAMLNLIHKDGGEIYYFGMPFAENENDIKKKIGYTAGSASYYSRKRIKDIVSVTKTFYDNWQEEEYRKYLNLFNLDENKRVVELSEGMKVKLQLAIALSHKAELLILDEPTSGLDPISREELLDIFIKIAKEGVSILFSTHITSDLEKCADKIIYIKQGKIAFCNKRQSLIDGYRTVCGGAFSKVQELAIIGKRESKSGNTALIKAESSNLFDQNDISTPNLEELIILLESSQEKL